jgi:hypothetical protein
VHQEGRTEAWTFWADLSAVRRAMFLAVGRLTMRITDGEAKKSER